MCRETVLEMQDRKAAAGVSYAAEGERRTAQRMPRLPESAPDRRTASKSEGVARSQRCETRSDSAPVERNTPRASTRIHDGQALRDHAGAARRTPNGSG